MKRMLQGCFTEPSFNLVRARLHGLNDDDVLDRQSGYCVSFCVS